MRDQFFFDYDVEEHRTQCPMCAKAQQYPFRGRMSDDMTVEQLRVAFQHAWISLIEAMPDTMMK